MNKTYDLVVVMVTVGTGASTGFVLGEQVVNDLFG